MGVDGKHADPINNYPINVTFTITNFDNSTIASVHDSTSPLDVENGVYSDTFDPFEVNIYTIPK